MGPSPSSPAIPRWLPIVALPCLCAFYFFYGLSAGELYRTESLRAILSSEVLRSGDWIVPRLYGEPMFTKPPGMYLAIALVSRPFGEVSEATARLPSALAASLTVLLFYWYFKRQLGQYGGLLAAVILPTSLMWLDKAPSAEIDMVQVFWVTAAILFFLRAVEDTEARSSILWWILALLAVAGGFLTKWTAPAFFYGMAVPFLWWRGRLRLLWGRNHLIASTLGASLCFAWAGAAIAQTGWDVFYQTVSREALMRLSPAHHHRPYPWHEVLGHPLVILGANLPWSACALVSLWPGFMRLWDDREQRLVQALHCWTWPNLLFWTVIPEHASRHSMPLCPGLSGLAAMVWLAWLTGRLTWPLSSWPRLAPVRVMVGFLALWAGIKIGFIQLVIPARNGEKVPLLEIISPVSKPAREPRVKAAQIAALVPEGKTLYLFMLKDEGIMFYYGRRVIRLPNPELLPSSAEPLYCMLAKRDHPTWPRSRTKVVLLEMTDEQGDPIVLVKTVPTSDSRAHP